MSKRTSARRTAPPLTELERLNQIRLDADLTYDQLAEAIGIDASAVFRILNWPTRKPHDRTLHKIRRFLAEQQDDTAMKPVRRVAAR